MGERAYITRMHERDGPGEALRDDVLDPWGEGSEAGRFDAIGGRVVYALVPLVPCGAFDVHVRWQRPICRWIAWIAPIA